MSGKKKIQFRGASFESPKLLLKTNGTALSVPMRAEFRHLDANAMGVKELIFPEGEVTEDFKSTTFSWEFYGAKLTIRGMQKNLFGDKPLVQRALLVDGFKVIRYEDDKLQIKFTALFADENAEVDQFVRAIKREGVQIDLEPASDGEKHLAISLLGKRLRFAHMPPGQMDTRITSVSYDGMVTIEGLPSEFAPHLFVEVPEPPSLKGINARTSE
jgi:hypothetical protein